MRSELSFPDYPFLGLGGGGRGGADGVGEQLKDSE